MRSHRSALDPHESTDPRNAIAFLEVYRPGRTLNGRHGARGNGITNARPVGPTLSIAAMMTSAAS